MSETSKRSPPRATLAEVQRLAHEADEFAEFEAVALASGLTPEEADDFWRSAPPLTMCAVEDDDLVVAEPESSGAWVAMDVSSTAVPER